MSVSVEEYLELGNEPKFIFHDYQSWKQGKSDFDILESYFYSIANFFQKLTDDTETKEYMKLITQYTGTYIADVKADYFERDSSD